LEDGLGGTGARERMMTMRMTRRRMTCHHTRSLNIFAEINKHKSTKIVRREEWQ
jgi:hypothetical protein